MLALGILAYAGSVQAITYYASKATESRVTIGTPDLGHGWQEFTDPFTVTWPLPLLKGWVKPNLHGVMQFGFHATDHELYRDEYERNLGSGFEEEGGYLQSAEGFEVNGYHGKDMIYASKGGDGQFTGTTGTPTIVRYIFIPFEKEPDRKIWPILVAYCAAPASEFDEVNADFQALLPPKITPLPGSVVVRVTDSAFRVIPNVLITLSRADNSKAAEQALSDSLGSRVFTGLDSGSYTLKAVALADSTLEPYAPDAAFDVVSGRQIEFAVILRKRAPKVIAEAEHVRHGASPETLSLGIGYRHRLTDIWGLGFVARIGGLVPELTLGVNDSMAFGGSLGVSYFPIHYDKLWAGLGLFACASAGKGAPNLSFELPLTLEYFVIPPLSVQASVGPIVSKSDSAYKFSFGPRTIVSSLGLTWYPK